MNKSSETGTTGPKQLQEDNYSQIARWYDPVVSLPMWRVRRTIRKLIRDSDAVTVLDIACGTGQQLRMLSSLGLSLTGIDASPSMLAIARNKESEGIDYIQDTIQRLPFQDSSFDSAIISMTLHEMEPDAASESFDEALRVIRPGGILYLVDYCRLRGFWSKLATRVVDFVESRTEGDHYRNYHRWMAGGAVEGFLERQNLSFKLLRRFMLGTAALLEIHPE